MKAWDVGLPCQVCGQRVTRGGGFYCQPILPSGKAGVPWAEHMSCREDKRK